MLLRPCRRTSSFDGGPSQGSPAVFTEPQARNTACVTYLHCRCLYASDNQTALTPRVTLNGRHGLLQLDEWWAWSCPLGTHTVRCQSHHASLLKSSPDSSDEVKNAQALRPWTAPCPVWVWPARDGSPSSDAPRLRRPALGCAPVHPCTQGARQRLAPCWPGAGQRSIRRTQACIEAAMASSRCSALDASHLERNLSSIGADAFLKRCGQRWSLLSGIEPSDLGESVARPSRITEGRSSAGKVDCCRAKAANLMARSRCLTCTCPACRHAPNLHACSSAN